MVTRFIRLDERSILKSSQPLVRRKGGGGKGGSRGSSGGSSGGDSGSGGSSSGRGDGGEVNGSPGGGTGGNTGGGTRGGSSGGGSDTPSYSIPGSSRTSSTYSTGGGSRGVIPAGTPFTGREIGGGSRSQIYGTTVYGSGYPYGAANSWLIGRPFPFGYWPLFWGSHHGYGSNEYGPAQNSSRPGGIEYTYQVRATSWANTTVASNATAPYHIVGDLATVQAIRDQLVSRCAIVNETQYLLPFSGVANASAPYPEQVIQYYRASSFALTLTTYNNTNSLASHAPASPSTPVNTTSVTIPNGTDLTFLTCLNSTIGDSIPILDSDVTNGCNGCGVNGSLRRSPLPSELTQFAALVWILIMVIRMKF